MRRLLVFLGELRSALSCLEKTEVLCVVCEGEGGGEGG